VAAGGTPTFGEIAEKLLESKEKEIRGKRNLDQWRSSLRDGAARLWSRRVDEIDTAAVLETPTPPWNEKRDLASRPRGRIEAVLDAAGPNFAITQVTPEQQAVTQGEVTEWKWEVKPTT
jgi:hypothetical protein